MVCFVWWLWCLWDIWPDQGVYDINMMLWDHYYGSKKDMICYQIHAGPISKLLLSSHTMVSPTHHPQHRTSTYGYSLRLGLGLARSSGHAWQGYERVSDFPSMLNVSYLDCWVFNIACDYDHTPGSPTSWAGHRELWLFLAGCGRTGLWSAKGGPHQYMCLVYGGR